MRKKRVSIYKETAPDNWEPYASELLLPTKEHITDWLGGIGDRYGIPSDRIAEMVLHLGKYTLYHSKHLPMRIEISDAKGKK